MRRGALAVVAGAVALAVVLALPVAAGQVEHPDPNDTAGRLDLHAVRFDDAGPLVWRLVTFGTWTTRQIWDRGYLIVQLDTMGDADVDHLLVVGSDGRELEGTLFRVRRDGQQVEIGAFPVAKDGPRAATVSVALHRLSVGPNRDSYAWSALASFIGKTCPRTCFDVVPDTGMVEQPLPGETPSPSPSPSPTG